MGKLLKRSHSASPSSSSSRVLGAAALRARRSLAFQSVLFLGDALLMALFYACCAKTAADVFIQKVSLGSDVIIMAACAAAGRLLLQLLLAWANSRLVYHTEKCVRADLFAAIVRHGPFSAQVTTALAPAAGELSETISPFFTAYRRTMRQVMILPVVLLVFIAHASWMSALILALLCPLIPLFMVLIGKKAAALNERQLLQISRLSHRFFDALAHLPLIFVFNLGLRERAAVRRMSRRWRVQTMQILYIAFLSAMALEFFATVGVAFCAITLGFAVYEHGFSYEQALFVLLCAPEFFVPLRRLGQNYHSKQRAIAAAERFGQLFAPLNEKPADQAADKTSSAAADQSSSPAAAAADTAFNFRDLREIRFHSVTTLYPDGRCGVSNLSLTIRAGCINVLTGPSGCGKSTVLYLLCGLLRPHSGFIELCFQDGRCVDLNSLSPQQLQSFYTQVPQQPYLFYGTLRDNLCQADPEISEERLQQLLQLTGAQNFISELPQGLDTVIGDDHAGLSGGQARLAALTRALVKPAAVLLLDEPSASLDAAGEQALAEAFSRLKGERTLVIAAHRPQLIALADQEINLAAA